MPAEPPPGLEELKAALTTAGFTVSGPVEAAGFGDVSWSFESPHFSVMVSSDRGDWGVNIAAWPERQWLVLDVWQACVEKREPNFDSVPIEQQLEWVASNAEFLARVLSEQQSAKAFVDCLHRTREARGRKVNQIIFGEE